MTQPVPLYPDSESLVNHWWWRPGWQVGTRFYAWHFTLNDQPQLRDLVARYQQTLAGFPNLDAIPDPWKHITVQGVGHSDEVSESILSSIADSVAGRLKDVAAPVVIFHGAAIHHEAIVVPPTDPDPVRKVRSAIRSGMGDAVGNGQVPENADGYRPHVSVAYANAAGGTRAIRRALDASPQEPVEVAIKNVSLIEMHRDRKMYEWITVCEVPIGFSTD